MYKKILIAAIFSYMLPVTAATVDIGVLKHDLRQSTKSERGIDLNIEYINQEYKTLGGNPHIGVSLSSKNLTHRAFAGLTWHGDLSEMFFIEGSLGGTIHSGKLTKAPGEHRIAFGSRLLFRESLSIGINLGNNTLTAMISHISNASLAPPNAGLTSAGVRYRIKL